MGNVAALESPSSNQRSEHEARVTLAACYRLIAHYGMDDLIFTHISARVPGHPEHFLINPYGMMFHEITASTLVKIDHEGNPVDGADGAVNKAGFVIHSALHAARPDIDCVLHTHTRAGVAVSCLEDGLLPLNQFALPFYKRIAYHDYEGLALDLGERERLARDLGDKLQMVLRNHGLIALGRTVPEAFIRMYYLEQSCRVQMDLIASGQKLRALSPELCEHTVAQFDRAPMPPGVREWPALLRLLDAKDPSYRQ